jgi:hypothetical protein
MDELDQDNDVWLPETEAEKQLVLAQMEKLLKDPHFRSSKRYPGLLSFVVEQTLAGNEDSLKERILGVEVFHRAPDYDTSLDPVVRLSASEVRKRIAQYYQSPEHQKELRIELNPGSYIPVFSKPPEALSIATVDLPAAPAEVKPAKRSNRLRTAYWIAGALAAGILLAAGVVHWKHSQAYKRESAFDAVWSPLLNSNRNILVCLGESSMSDPNGATPGQNRPDNDSMAEAFADKRDFVPFPDVQAFSRFITLLSVRGHAFSVQTSPSIVYSQLRENSVLLIGALNNPWTLNRTATLRFRFAGDDGPYKTVWIEDTQHPGSREWKINSQDPRSQVKKDFAIVARFTDDGTGQAVMIAAGLAGSGTKAAGEFLTDENSLEQLGVNAPRDWEHKNFEAVISSQVVDGMQGKPSVVAKVFW